MHEAISENNIYELALHDIELFNPNKGAGIVDLAQQSIYTAAGAVSILAALRYVERMSGITMSRRGFLSRLGGATALGAAVMLESQLPILRTAGEYGIEAVGIAPQGTEIPTNMLSGLANIAVAESVQTMADAYMFEKWRLPIRTKKIASEEHINGDRLIRVAVRRGNEAPMGNAELYITQKAPGVFPTSALDPGCLAATQDYIVDLLKRRGYPDVAGFCGPWSGHAAVSYAQAMRVKESTRQKLGKKQLENATLHRLMNSLDKGKTRFTETGYATSFYATSATHEFNTAMATIFLPNSDRGYPGAADHYVQYAYNDNSWDYAIVDSQQVAATLNNSNADTLYSIWKPLLVLDEATGKSLDYVDRQQNVLYPGGSFVAKDKNGNLVYGNCSASFPIKMVPSEFWSLIKNEINNYGFELQHVFLSDAGGIAGVATSEKWNIGTRSSETQPLNNFSVYRNSSVFGPRAELMAHLVERFHIQHTMSGMHVCLPPHDMQRILTER